MPFYTIQTSQERSVIIHHSPPFPFSLSFFFSAVLTPFSLNPYHIYEHQNYTILYIYIHTLLWTGFSIHVMSTDNIWIKKKIYTTQNITLIYLYILLCDMFQHTQYHVNEQMGKDKNWTDRTDRDQNTASIILTLVIHINPHSNATREGTCRTSITMPTTQVAPLQNPLC